MSGVAAVVIGSVAGLTTQRAGSRTTKQKCLRSGQHWSVSEQSLWSTNSAHSLPPVRFLAVGVISV